MNNTLFGFLAGGSADNQVTGIEVADADGTVSGNAVYDFQVTGVYAHGPRLQVTGNSVYRGGVGTFGGSGTGIVASGVAGTTPTVVSGNTVFDNSAGGIIASTNVLVGDNAVYGQTSSEGIQTNDGTARIENNAVFGNLDGIVANATALGHLGQPRLQQLAATAWPAPTSRPRSAATPSTPTASACRCRASPA